MDWLLATPQIYSAFSSLGSLEGDTYVVSPNALAILEEINYKLTYEDQTLRTFRRAIGFGQNVRADLIPLLENTKDNDVLDSVIRILVNLTVPVECLFSVDIMYRTEVGRHTIFELNKLLYTSKEAFTDPKSTKSVVEYMKHILESDSKLSLQKCDQINNCLLLLRNVLHIPETNATFILPSAHSQANGGHAVSMQNSILWNLFIQSIDKLLLYLMTCPQRAFWGVTMVQLIALMYKDQHVSTLQKLLNMWFEASLSESSEDNESNTSPPKQGSGDSSPMLTSDPTSDSSDNGSGGCKNESSEDWRQALREETDATLQEVSRKGQEYQNSILCAPMEKLDSLETGSDVAASDCYEPYTSAQVAVAAVVKGLLTACEHIDIKIEIEEMEAMEAVDEEDDMASDIAATEPNAANEDIAESNNDNNKQPAQHIENTSKAKQSDADAAKFKPPPPAVLPTKAITAAASTKTEKSASQSEVPPHKQCQKVPHSGQLNLTKGKCCPQKRECPSSQSELSDCGYGTQVENQESISTSSNDDDGPQGKPQHQKPPCNSKPRNKQRAVLVMVDKKELRRKKLVKRSKSSLINMKGLVQHTPTDDDISNLLKEFTVDFLLKGYGYLVGELHSQLLTNIKVPIDTSHFFWLVTYFLKFAAQLELDMEHISTVLTFDVIGYLTYEGVSLCEQLELNSRQEGSDLKPYLRRIHLVVTAIREFLQAIETYKKVTHLSEDDRRHLRHLQSQISATEDLRCLFVLLLRRFNPSLHTKQYLQDLVVTNHILLLILDGAAQTTGDVSMKMMEHISQFATLEVMNYYGMLLEDFNNNGEFVNNCIFTMMHHVGGDLGQIGTLFQPIILKTYSRIWEADYELCDDWSDLIEYVIHKFINTPQKSPLSLPTTSLTELTKEHNLENTVCTWTQEEMDTLYWYYVQSKKNNDVVGKIVKLFSNNGNKQKSRISIIQQLLQQDIITLVEYDDLMKFEDAEYQRALLTTPTSTSTESGIELKNSSSSFVKPSDDIQILRDLILKEKKEKHLVWLQKILLECCYIKLILKNSLLREDHQHLEYVMEPVAYHCILKNKSIPVVQWNNDQATTMLYQPFVLLLHKLGFQLPADAGSIFARIPDFWAAETLYSLAKKLGPLDKLLIKFDVSQFEDANAAETATQCHHATSARASLSSVSSLDTEMADGEEVATTVSGMGSASGPLSGSCSSGYGSGFGSFSSASGGSILATVPEVDAKLEKANATSDIFAVPKTKHCNSIISRFTPEPTSTPTVPNWLQLVMRSKFNTGTTASNPAATATTATATASEINNILSTLVTTTTATTTTATTSAATVRAAPQQYPTTATLLATASCSSVNNIIGLNNEIKSSNSNINSNNSSGNGNNKHENNNKIATEVTTTTKTSPAATIAANLKEYQHQHQHQQQQQPQKQQQQQMQHQQQQQQQHQQQQKQQQHLQQQQQKQQKQQQHQQQSQRVNESVAVKPLERDISTRVGGTGSGNLDSEYSAMVAAVYEHEIAYSDSASVASDLTRMYVSDEDEKHEFPVTHFH